MIRGRVSEWKDDRGFGFIEPESGGERVFFHISSWGRGANRPSVGDMVSFELSATSDGKLRAQRVCHVGVASVVGLLGSRRIVLAVIGMAIFPTLWWLGALGVVQRVVLSVVAGMSVISFVMYGMDKWAATREAPRTPENVLHLGALLGGWPGALVAQQVFRHKSRKHSFQIVFWITVLLNCGVVGYLSSPFGPALFAK